MTEYCIVNLLSEWIFRLGQTSSQSGAPQGKFCILYCNILMTADCHRILTRVLNQYKNQNKYNKCHLLQKL